MKKSCLSRWISWLLIFSILHLQFSSLAYGGRPEELYGNPPGTHLRRPPPEDCASYAVGCGKENLRPFQESLLDREGSHDRVLTVANADLDAVTQIQAVLANILGEHNLDPSFREALSSFHYALHADEEMDPKTRTPIHMTAGSITLLASGAMALLFYNSGLVKGLLFPDRIGKTIGPYRAQAAGAAVGAGGLICLDTYPYLKDLLAKIAHFRRLPHPVGSEDVKWGLVVVSAFPAIIGFVTEAFVYGTTFIGAPLGVIIFGSIVGGPYLALRLSQVVTGTLDGYPRALDIYEKICGILQRTFGSSPPLPKEIPLNGDTVKKEIRGRLAQGVRRVIDDSRAALMVWEYVQTVRQEVDTACAETKTATHQLETAYRALPQKTTTDKDAHESQIATLQNKIKMAQWVGDMLILRAYYDFDQEGRYPMGPGHPFYYKAAQISGAILGGMSCVASWYAMARIYTALFGGPPGPGTYVSATVSAAALTGLLMRGCVEGVTDFVSLIAGYHPVKNNPVIEGNTQINHRGLRVLITTLNVVKSQYLSLPTSLLGARAMGVGIGPEAPAIPPVVGRLSTMPNLVAWAFVGHNETKVLFHENATKAVQTIKKKMNGAAAWVKGRFWRAQVANEGETLLDAEERMQKTQEDLMARARQVFGEGKDFYPNLQQHLADHYTRIDAWLRSLNGKQILALDHYLRTPAEEWFISGRYTPPTPPEPVALRPAELSSLGEALPSK